MALMSPFSRPIQFCPLPNHNFEKNARNLGEPAEPWIQNPSGFLPIFMEFKSFHEKIPCHIKHYSMDKHAQYSQVPHIIMFCQKRPLKIKCPRTWNMYGHFVMKLLTNFHLTRYKFAFYK